MKTQFYQVKTNSERYVTRKDSLAKLFDSDFRPSIEIIIDGKRLDMISGILV